MYQRYKKIGPEEIQAQVRDIISKRHSHREYFLAEYFEGLLSGSGYVEDETELEVQERSIENTGLAFSKLLLTLRRKDLLTMEEICEILGD